MLNSFRLYIEDIENKRSISYTGVVLNDGDRTKLLQQVKGMFPHDWRVIAHHMTINLGKAKNPELVGLNVSLKVVAFGLSNMAAAVKVETNIPSDNVIKHITVAVNPVGGKPKMSNEIQNWTPIQTFLINGIISEIPNSN